MSLNIGDRVTILFDAPYYGDEGTVRSVTPGRNALVAVDGRSGVTFYYADELQVAPTPAQRIAEYVMSESTTDDYVHVVDARQIWVTLPGDTAGHKLTETQARTLFHQLEEIL